MSCKNNGKKNKALMIIGMVFLIVIVVLCILAFTFRSHIKAAIIFLTTSDEDILKNIDAAKEQQTEVLNSSGFYANKEADDALMAGEITAEQHTQILLGNLTLDELKEQNNENVDETIPEENQGSDETLPEEDTDRQEDQADKETQTPDVDKPKEPDGKKENAVPDTNSGNTVKENAEQLPAQQTPADKTPAEGTQTPSQQTAPPVQQLGEADKKIAELVTKMYVLKADYTASIDAIIASMKAEYVLLPVEQRTRSAKQNIATKYLGQINAMEVQCDAQVNAIVSDLKQILKENGRDMALADSILSTYATEKENTKAYYISTYGD